MNDYVHIEAADLRRPNARFTTERQGYQVLTPFGKLGYSQIYRAHDILIMPSLFEGFGKVWMEAMAEGTCVVGFAEGGLQDVARHEEHALLCDTGDTEALTALLHRALNDLDTTRQLGRRAQAQVRLFTWDRHANATERFVERTLAKKAAAAS